MIERVCVYCASSAKVSPVYFEAVEHLAKVFVQQQIEVVFGGGAIGLMGRLADVVIQKGGKIIGIMPHFMNDVEWAHKEVTEFHFVEDMHERKKRFLEGVDAVIALPGGSGTLEELLEVITLKRLGLFIKPIIILNTAGYYDPLQVMLDRCIEQEFMHQKHRDMWCFVHDPADVIPAIKAAPVWDRASINFAALRR